LKLKSKSNEAIFLPLPARIFLFQVLWLWASCKGYDQVPAVILRKKWIPEVIKNRQLRNFNFKALKEDFSRMRFDPTARGKGKLIWQHYTELQTRADLCKVPTEYIEVAGGSERAEETLDDIVRFSIMFCGKDGNPMAREGDFDVRMKRSLENLLIGKKDPSYDLITGWDSWVVKVMATFMRMQDNEKYQRWIAMKVQHQQNLEYIMMPASASDDPEKVMTLKEKIRIGLAKTAKDIQELENSLFPDAKVRDLINEHQQLILDGPGSFADYMVATEYPH
jgi:hypothetical protein